ncbi:MAG: hypothetical protein GX644_09465 [Limnobacter sp.]|nr:hypothetical protein [Limnobacter sp.]
MSSTISLPAAEIWATTILLTLVVVVLRNVFLVAPRDWQPRGKLERALRYAPLAALVALLAPEVLQPLATAAERAGPAGFAQGLTDPRFVSALVVIVVSRLTRNALAALAGGVGLFWLLAS